MRSQLIARGVSCSSLCCSQPANQAGIAHVAFRFADLEIARAFYDKLGFERGLTVSDVRNPVPTAR